MHVELELLSVSSEMSELLLNWTKEHYSCYRIILLAQEQAHLGVGTKAPELLNWAKSDISTA